MIYVCFTLNLILYFFRDRKKKEKEKIRKKKQVRGFFFLFHFPFFFGIQWKTQEIINAMLDLNSVQCSYHKTADHIRTRIHPVQHPSFNSHEYEGLACLECPFSWHAPAAVKSPRDYLRWRLQTSVFNRENGADHSPFKILITLLAPETSCSNEFHNLITGVIWQSTSFVYSKTAAWNLHWRPSRFCIVRNNEQLNSIPYIWDKD